MERQSITTKTLKTWINDFETIVKEMKTILANSDQSPDQNLKHALKKVASTDLIGRNVRLFKSIL